MKGFARSLDVSGSVEAVRVAMLDPSGFTLPYNHHLCGALAKRGNTVRLFVCPLREERGEREVLYEKVIHFYRFSARIRGKGFKGFFYYPAKGLEHVVNMRAIVSELHRWKPDIIHFQWIPLPVFDRLFLRSLKRISPLVLTVHDTNLFHGNPSFSLQLRGWIPVIRLFDRIIVHTNFSREELIKKGIPYDVISVIAHGVIKISSEDRREGNFSQGARAEGEKVILFFGSIKPYKGVDILIRAFARLPLHLQRRTRLRIAGEPRTDVEALKRLAEESGITSRIIWDLRFLREDEIPSVIQEADIVVFPYREIDASGALMTAIPYGKPIVATRVGGFTDIIKDGLHGLLVPPDDATSLSRALENLLSNPALGEKMGKEVKGLGDSIPSWDEIALMTERIYRRTAKDHRN